jgi:purine-binding chemotaxis protein CheW
MSNLALAQSTIRSFCTFRAQERLYGIDVAQVREVSTHVALTPVPQAPLLVRGLVNLRSRIYLVLDLRPALGLPALECTPDSRLIVLHPRVAEGLGLFVDRGGDIVRVSSEQIEEIAQPAADRTEVPDARAASPVAGVCKLATELMMIIDPKRLVDALEQEIR